MRIPLEFPEGAPDDWTPLEAVIVIKYIDPAGVVRLQEANTNGLSVWEAIGMLIWALDSFRDDLQKFTDEDP